MLDGDELIEAYAAYYCLDNNASSCYMTHHRHSNWHSNCPMVNRSKKDRQIDRNRLDSRWFDRETANFSSAKKLSESDNFFCDRSQINLSRHCDNANRRVRSGVNKISPEQDILSVTMSRSRSTESRQFLEVWVYSKCAHFYHISIKNIPVGIPVDSVLSTSEHRDRLVIDQASWQPAEA